MNTQEIKAVEEAAEAKANKLRLYTSKYDFSRGFIVGAQFLDELRKPSERPNVKDYFAATETLGAIHGEIVGAPRLYAYMQALDAYIDNLEEKPSEPETNVCEAGEELVERIEEILNKCDGNIEGHKALSWLAYKSVSTEIAALMHPDTWPPKPIGTTYATTKIDGKLLCVQPDKELLEAAKDALRTFYGIGCNEEAEIVQVLTKAIINYEKRSK